PGISANVLLSARNAASSLEPGRCLSRNVTVCRITDVLPQFFKWALPPKTLPFGKTSFAFGPVTDEVIGNGAFGRYEIRRVGLVEHGEDFLARKPPAVLQFFEVRVNFVVKRLAVATDH